MSILFWGVCLLFADPKADAAAPASTAPVELMTAKDFCEMAWKHRTAMIQELEKSLADLPKSKDWRRLSDDKKRAMERSLRREIAVRKADREIDWNDKYPSSAKIGEAFKLPRTNKRVAINDEYKVLEVINGTSVIVHRPTWKGDNLQFIIEGLKPEEFIDDPGSPIKLSGMWHKVEKRKLNGVTYERIARWPHQDEVENLWPKFLEERERPLKKPKSDEKQD